jgi:KUP system potassium uptake protein
VNIERRAVVSELTSGFERVTLKFEFMEIQNIPSGLSTARICVSPSELDDTSYYIGHETVIPDFSLEGMWQWREAVFMWMQRNSAATGTSFGIPFGQLVEVGTEIRI